MVDVLDGFWLPQKARQILLTEKTKYTTCSFCSGKACLSSDPGAISARWPIFTIEQWSQLFTILEENRLQAPVGEALWNRLNIGLQLAARRLSNPTEEIYQIALKTISGYTGYSAAMIHCAIQDISFFAPDQIKTAFSMDISRQVKKNWLIMDPLAGYLRFYPQKRWSRLAGMLSTQPDRLLHRSVHIPQVLIGYGAGNVPGTTLILTLLSLAISVVGGSPPITVIKNSRSEPIFSPLVLKILEKIDPQILSTMAVLVWDYEDQEIQKLLLDRTDLMIAVGSDATINQLNQQIVRASKQQQRQIRFHAHGHKVSFSALGKEVLALGQVEPKSKQSMLDIVALLAGLDSVFWDQQGCLSSRVHFVEESTRPGYLSALDYAKKLSEQLSRISSRIPRGELPLKDLHDRFDRYKQLELGGKVIVTSTYNDEFLIVIDRRPWDVEIFRNIVNICLGRTIFIRPIKDLMELPNVYLGMLPENNLQSLSMAVGWLGQTVNKRFMDFAAACGSRGVTAIRTVGRGAFPQLAYSWDGYLPLDLVCSREKGYFTTIEFQKPIDEIYTTYHFWLEQISGAHIFD